MTLRLVRACAKVLVLMFASGTISAAVQVELVADVCPGSCSGLDHRWPTSYASTASKVFFLGTPSGGGGYNVWSSDGTSAGTAQLNDPNPVNSDSMHTAIVTVGERVYFGADKDNGRWAVYESTGTPAGTRSVPLPNDDVGVSWYPIGITDWSGESWFERGGTVFRVAAPGAPAEVMTTLRLDYFTDSMVVRGNLLYAWGREGICCIEPERLWRISRDGSKTAITGVPDGAMESIHDGPGGILVHVQYDDALFKTELWRAGDDGSVARIRASAGRLGFVAQGMFGGRFWFSDAPAGKGAQLYSTDGTESGTRQETNLPTPVDRAQDFRLTQYRGQMYATAVTNDSVPGGTFVQLDSTHPLGARQVRALVADRHSPRVGPIFVYADRMFFSAENGGSTELWGSDGTAGGTQPVWFPDATAIANGVDYPIAIVDGWLYLRRTTSAAGTELWRMRAQPSDFGAQATQDVVEFYRASRDTYFLTGLPNEIALLDSGQLPGWARTGRGFVAYAPYAGGDQSNPVCRFYGLPAAGIDSHFYSAYASECDVIATQWPGAWQLETDSIFEVPVPAADGSCPTGYTPVYRNYNGRADVNHRYTTNLTDRETMIQRGWVSEGYGPKGVAMCALSVDPAGPGG